VLLKDILDSFLITGNQSLPNYSDIQSGADENSLSLGAGFPDNI
jgi:hypothetical protein